MNKQYHRGGFRTCQTSKMERFTKILNDWKALISFAKRPVLDVWQGSKYASIKSNIIVMNWLIIYLSLLCRLPKCPSHEGKLVLGTIQYGIYYCRLRTSTMFTRFRCWLKLHVGTSPSSCNKHSSFYFLDQYPGARRPRTTI